jgi:hypothetical protein
MSSEPVTISKSTMASCPSHLSENDALVLKAVFDHNGLGPLSSSSSNGTLVDPKLPPSIPHIDSALLPVVQAAEMTAIRPLDIPTPPPELVQRAIAQLTDLIVAHPSYASAYNNRAQALRLLVGDEFGQEVVRESTLWNDLCEAIRLATPATVGVRVSVLQGSVLAAAHTQRGYLLLKAARSYDSESWACTRGGKEGDGGESTRRLPEQLHGAEKKVLEEMASRDFEMGGRYGDQEAQKMATLTNPYARLCGQIVWEALRAEIRGVSGRDSPGP